jgi:hypothetical protein
MLTVMEANDLVLTKERSRHADLGGKYQQPWTERRNMAYGPTPSPVSNL